MLSGAFMRIVSLLMIAISAAAWACGGTTEGVPNTGTPDPGVPATSNPPASNPPVSDQPPTIHPPTTTTTGADCPNPTSVLVGSGGTIARPTGSALRLQLVYQGSSIGVKQVRGVDMILPGGDGPFSDNSGYWVETRSASKTTYQRLFRDPTIQEAPAGPGGSGFMNSTIDRCVAKTISADVPNDSSMNELIIFGSPYGTQDRAVELARFSIQ